MIVTTTPTIEGKKVVKYLGFVSGEAILGTHIFKDMFATITDIVGGRSLAYEEELTRAKYIAIEIMKDQATKLGANAVVGADLDYECIAQLNMMMVCANGTAVVYEE